MTSGTGATVLGAESFVTVFAAGSVVAVDDAEHALSKAPTTKTLETSRANPRRRRRLATR
jgi:hypothetical protein